MTGLAVFALIIAGDMISLGKIILDPVTEQLCSVQIQMEADDGACCLCFDHCWRHDQSRQNHTGPCH